MRIGRVNRTRAAYGKAKRAAKDAVNAWAHVGEL